MKRKIILITLLCSLFIISFLIGILFVKNVKGSSQEIDYQFQNDIYVNNPSFNGSHYNVRNQSTYTNHYNATYSFKNDIISQNPINWSDNGLTYQEIENHSKIIGIYGNNNITQVNFNNDYLEGTIEYWIFTTDSDKRTNLYFWDTTGGILALEIRLDNFAYHNGTDFFYWKCLSNQWYHIRIEWFTNNKVDIYCNSILEIDNKSLTENQTNGFDFFKVQLFASNYIYLDAIGFSFDSNYNIYDNIIPYQTINSDIKEVDKFTFDYESFLDNYDVGDDNPSTWSDIESGGDDDCNIALHQTDYRKRRIYMEQYAPDTDDTGIEKEFEIESGIIDLYWSVNFTKINGFNEFCTKVYSYDDTLVSDIYFEGSNLIYDYRGSNNLYTSITINKSYELFLYINYYDNISILDFYIDKIYENTYFIPLLVNNKDGLGKIEIFIDVNVANDMWAYLDDVGVYINGSSLSTELGYLATNPFDIITPYVWYFKNHNLFNFKVIGNSSFHILRDPYLPDISTVSRINPLNYYNESEFYNLYDFIHDSESYCQYPILWIEFYNQIEFIQLTISGVKLIEGSNQYFLEYSHSGIDTNKSYFYVKSNRLYFIHYANENDTLEYIQAKFNINDIYAINRSINFKTYFLGISKAFFVNEYVSLTTSIFELPISHKSFNFILPQEKIISNFSIIITDQNNNAYYGKSEGYISNIKLQYYPDIEMTILTLNLIGIMIVIILLFIPTIAVYSVYGKKAIIPMLILMTIICFISELIPTWLFFILMFCYSSTIFLQFKQKRGIT